MRKDRLSKRARRRVSSAGGKARAKVLRPEQRSKVARRAAQARWSAYRAEIVEDTEEAIDCG